MKFNRWLKYATAEEREKVAKESGTKEPHLWQIAGHHSYPSPQLEYKLKSAVFNVSGVEIEIGEDFAMKAFLRGSITSNKMGD